ncbi:lipopolysaccharide assembly protein LapB [Actinomadura sp. K4S16]|uniref:tetratricopeptide repeat protein n=1 Tax=Actinomadura sp. K4S16 TaxID=1316147 RepID=UPI0011EE3A3F|nr:tetratricopeptide repeat protein [Actinomadura sp. K4S16]
MGEGNTTVGGTEDGSSLLRRFADELRELKRNAGSPSLKEIQGRTVAKPGIATISALLAGRGERAPRWDLVSDVVTALVAYAEPRGLELDARMADTKHWRRRHELLVQAMERAAADRTARLGALLAEFSVLPPNRIRRPPFPTLGELSSDWDGKPSPKGGVYLPRPDFDEELCAALAVPAAPYPFVLVYGDDGAGKSTSAWHAVEEVLPPNTRVLVPQGGNALAALAENKDLTSIAAPPTLIWADGLTVEDLDCLTRETVDRLASTVFIVATVSAHDCAAILDAPRGRLPVARDALRSAYLLHLLYEPEIIEQVTLNSVGDAVSLDADQIGDAALDADMMILRLTTARTGSPEGMALVRAAVDCRRAGLKRPVSDSELRRLFPHYLAEIRNISATDELFEAGITWAQGAGSANDALLTVMPRRGRDERLWGVARVLVDGAEPNRAIPDALWAELIDFATPEECTHIGMRAGDLRRLAYSAEAHTKAAAMRSLEPQARLLAAAAYSDLGDRRAARESFEAGYHAAVRDGLSGEACFAACQLGNIANADGDTDAAIGWWTDAADCDQDWSPDACLALATHHALSGEVDRAVELLDRDFSSAKPAVRRRAVMVLAALRPTPEGLAEVAGDRDGSVDDPEERLLRSALIDYVTRRIRNSEAGDAAEAVDVNRAETLFDQGYRALLFGSKQDAATAFERCIECGDAQHSVNAALELGRLRREEGDAAGAERALAVVLDLGGPEMAARARFNMGLLRMDVGDEVGAVAILESVLATGDTTRRAHAAVLIAHIRKSQGADVDVVDGLYRLAIDADDAEWSPLALTELGLRHYGRDGATDEAVSLLSRASTSRHSEAGAKAAWILGRLLEDREDFHGAIQTYQKAIAAGHPDFTPAAHSSLGQLYGVLNQTALAMRHLEIAYNSKHPEYRLEAAFHLGLLHYWFGRFRNAAAMLREVVSGQHPRLWPHAGVLLGQVYGKLGDVSRAAEAWQTVASSGIEPDASEAMANLRELGEAPLALQDLSRGHDSAEDESPAPQGIASVGHVSAALTTASEPQGLGQLVLSTFIDRSIDISSILGRTLATVSRAENRTGWQLLPPSPAPWGDARWTIRHHSSCVGYLIWHNKNEKYDGTGWELAVPHGRWCWWKEEDDMPWMLRYLSSPPAKRAAGSVPRAWTDPADALLALAEWHYCPRTALTTLFLLAEQGVSVDEASNIVHIAPPVGERLVRRAQRIRDRSGRPLLDQVDEFLPLREADWKAGGLH